MIATAYRMKAESANGSGTDLRGELERSRQALANGSHELSRRLRERDAQIAELTVQNAALKQALSEVRRPALDPTWVG